MKFSINKEELSQALELVNRATPARPSWPILKNILFKVNSSQLELTVFDGSVGIKTRAMLTSSEIEGDCCLPAGAIVSLVKAMPDGDISFDRTDANQVEISIARSRYKLACLDAEDFPSLPADEGRYETKAFHLNREMISSFFGIEAFTSKDQAKMALAGLCFTLQNGALEVAATDARQAQIRKVEAEIELGKDARVVAPVKLLQLAYNALRSIPGEGKQRVSILLHESSGNSQHISIEVAGELGDSHAVISCSLLPYEYPRYNMLLPVQFSRTVTVERTALQQAIKRIEVIVRNKSDMLGARNIEAVSLDIQPDCVKLSALAGSFGDGQELVDCQLSGDPVSIAFNWSYLDAMLRQFNSRDISIQINSGKGSSPALFTEIGSAVNCRHYLFPIEISAISAQSYPAAA